MTSDMRDGLRDITRRKAPDLWTEIERRAEQGDRPPVPRGHRGTALVVGILITLLGVIVPLLALRADDAGEPIDAPTDGLEIDNVEVVDVAADESQVTLRFDNRWRGATYPGTHSCTWEVLGPDGAPIGRFTDEVTSLRPSATGVQVTVDVEGPASSASGWCDAQRLDVGEPYAYDFADTQVELATPGIASVSSSASWLGGGYPGAVTCAVVVFGSEGEALGQQVLSLLIAEGEGRLARDVSVGGVTSAEQLGGASIGCVPFSRWIPPTELISIDVAALRASVEELGWPAFDGMQDDRLAEWSATIDAEHLTIDEVAAGMDLLTQVLSVRPEESVDVLWVRELMARRGHLCALLPTEHPYRGGEYCD